MNKEKFATQLQNIKPSPMLQMFEAAGKYKDLINLGIGEPDFDTDESIINASSEAGKKGFTHYAPVPGFMDLRLAIAKYWKERYKLDTCADEVMVAVGATQALHLTFQTILNPGDEILVTDPCFTPYLQQIEYLGGKAVCVPVYEENGFNLTAESLEKHITDKTKAVLINSPNNPTGAVMDRAEALKIAEVIVKHDLILISDEVYEAFLFEGEHVCFATLPGMKERTYTVGSFSKTYAMTGWRIGYVIAPVSVVNLMRIISIATSMCVNSMGQKAALYAIENRNDQGKEMVEVYRKRVDYTVERINKIPGMSCIKPKGSFYVFINIKEISNNSLEFCLKMVDDARVIMIPGIAFGVNGEGFARIACTVSEEVLGEALDRLEAAIKG